MTHNKAYEYASSLIDKAHKDLNKYQNTSQLIELGKFIISRKS